MPPQLDKEFGTVPDLIRFYADTVPDKHALTNGIRAITYAELAVMMERIAASLQRDAVPLGTAIAICAAQTTIEYAAAFFGILRAGAVVAPLAPSSTPDVIGAQLRDCAAPILFVDSETATQLQGVIGAAQIRCVSLDNSSGGMALDDWMLAPGASAGKVRILPDHGFNIIYTSGTTGTPKGIFHSHAMRWAHMRRAIYPRDATTMISTPLYSNTTLVAFLPTIAAGGTVVLLEKFDTHRFLKLAEALSATHAMLVPVQYARLLDHPQFEAFDLSAFRMKFCVSAPFSPKLKRAVLDRWPGALTEFYGMTEGGVTCALRCEEFPHKLHTVGTPLPGHELRLIDRDGVEVAPGEIGEIVGRSNAMMTGYYNQPDRTAEAEWYAPDGSRFIRTGDIGRLDADGFLILSDRMKDMIISGGFNIYPGDIEAELALHEALDEVAVVGVPSATWGETPVAFVVPHADVAVDGASIKQWLNGRVGKTQRLSEVLITDRLPRSEIGKILKRELRDRFESLRSAR